MPEASSLNVSSEIQAIVREESATKSGATVDGKISQFRLKEDEG